MLWNAIYITDMRGKEKKRFLKSEFRLINENNIEVDLVVLSEQIHSNKD